MTPYHFTLNKSTLLFFPSPDAKQGPHVVQVFIRTKRRVNASISPQASVRELTSFYIVQVDITVRTPFMLRLIYETEVRMKRVVTSLVHAHTRAPMAAEIILEGEGYSLRGHREHWEYGESLKLAWGEERVTPCPDKWIFLFTPT
ncbi:hypothetical protein FIBSPDRAFT_928711 [Athelia psychrophila]|uniref:Uncharacterized protein n=1 Tax=Athelia psychrophila TaxID=1759441 RepID=A0A166PNA8_9AGAM|nr:hypothetical protein FIBSPDRAFT_928711 [Fibularhizoctonia sp. CBS 109695]